MEEKNIAVEEFKVFINKRLRLNRKSKKEISVKLSMSDSMFARILSGERKIDLNKLEILAQELNIDFLLLISKAKNAGIIGKIDYEDIISSAGSNVIVSILNESANKDNVTDKNSDTFLQDPKIQKYLGELTINDLSSLAKKILDMEVLVEKLKDYNFAMDYCLEGKLSKEIITKLKSYITYEIESSKIHIDGYSQGKGKNI